MGFIPGIIRNMRCSTHVPYDISSGLVPNTCDYFVSHIFLTSSFCSIVYSSDIMTYFMEHCLGSLSVTPVFCRLTFHRVFNYVVLMILAERCLPVTWYVLIHYMCEAFQNFV